jgi:hypothetical protein
LQAAGGGVVDEIGLAVIGNDHLGIGGKRAGEAKHLALERGRRVDRDRSASRDVELEQPRDRLVEGVECRVGGDLLRLALQDVLDREVRGRAHKTVLPAKPRPTTALIW